MRATASRLRAACGVLGPAAFTAAWLVGMRHQAEYAVAHEHISGLAAPDAEVPHVMTTGFVALGACTIAFAAELEERLSAAGRRPGAGPTLMAASGIAMVAAGVFRRDRRSNFPAPDEVDGPQSWRNDLHDLAAVAAAGTGIGALLALGHRFRDDPAWRRFARPAAAAAGGSAVLSAWFARDVTRPGNGIVQRASVTIPLAFMARVAVQLLRAPAGAPDQRSASSGINSPARSTSRAIAATSSSIES
ncbi:MAG TPA: DUF998 domain-containing protein [Actinomycetota bacterium]